MHAVESIPPLNRTIASRSSPSANGSVIREFILCAAVVLIENLCSTSRFAFTGVSLIALVTPAPDPNHH